MANDDKVSWNTGFKPLLTASYADLSIHYYSKLCTIIIERYAQGFTRFQLF